MTLNAEVARLVIAFKSFILYLTNTIQPPNSAPFLLVFIYTHYYFCVTFKEALRDGAMEYIFFVLFYYTDGAFQADMEIHFRSAKMT